MRSGAEIVVGGERGSGNHVCGAEFGIRLAATREARVHDNRVGAGVASRVTFDSRAEMQWGIRLDDGVVLARVNKNTIADASQAAISVVGDASQDNSLISNQYLRNGIDIDLGADGPRRERRRRSRFGAEWSAECAAD